MRRTLVAAVLSLMLLGVALGGCGSANVSPGLSGGGASPATQGKTFKIGVLIPNLPDPFHQSVFYGIWKEAGLLHDVKVVMYDAGGFANVSKQVSQMDDLLQLGVDAVILCPTNTSAMVPSVNAARAKGKPVVLYGSVVNTKYTSFIASDQKQLGEDQAKYMVQALHGEGKIALMPGPAGVSWAVDREKAFRDYVQAHSKIQMIAEKWTDSSRQAGLTTMEDLLQAHPGLDGVYTGTDYMADGAAEAAKAAGAGGKLFITTSVMSPDTEKLIEQGLLAMSSAQQSVLIGETSLKVALSAAKGEDVKPIYPIPDVFVTKDNVKTTDQTTINAPLGWKPPQSF